LVAGILSWILWVVIALVLVGVIIGFILDR
jgi:hypothetical protein